MSADPAGTLETLTCESDLVVLGKLGKGTSPLTIDQGYILTDWNLTVEQVFRDNSLISVQPGQTIVVTRSGGELTINGRHVYAVDDDFPRFHTGEEVLLYLRSLPGTYALILPDGFFLSSSKIIPMDRRLGPQFAAVHRSAFLELVQSAATASGPSFRRAAVKTNLLC